MISVLPMLHRERLMTSVQASLQEILPAVAYRITVESTALIEALFCEVNPIPVKKAVNLMGMEVGGLRMPLTELSEEHTAQLKKAMQEFGIQLA